MRCIGGIVWPSAAIIVKPRVQVALGKIEISRTARDFDFLNRDRTEHFALDRFELLEVASDLIDRCHRELATL